MIEFEEHLCTCDHSSSVHDDGFGCTQIGCDCLAGWAWAADPDEEMTPL